MNCANHPQVVDALVECARCRKSFCHDCVVELKGQPYCAACKGEQVRDIQSGADSTQLDLASIGVRFGALFIDGLLVAAVAFGISFAIFAAMAAGGATEFGLGAQILVGFVASIPALVYEGLMLQMRGQTLGKMALRIKVVTAEGADITPGQAWTRAAVRVVFNNLRILSIVNYVTAFFGTQKMCIHDTIAKTRVIYWRP